MISRRTVLAALSVPVLAGSLRAQTNWPEKPIRVIVPFGPGGLADVTTRVVGEKMSAILGQQIVVVNQPGAGGIAAAMTVKTAAPDGYTLALFTNGTAISVPLVAELGFDPLKDFVPISSLGYFDFVVVVAADSGYKSLADVIAAAKSKSGGINIGTINIGSTQNLSAELLRTQAGGTMTIIPYRNSPDAVTALLRKDVDFVIDGYTAVRAMLQDKRVTAIATSGPKRSPLTPDVPTAMEAGLKDFDVTSWNALYARAGTPDAVIAKLNAAVLAATADADVKKKLLDLGIEAKGSTPAEISARLTADIAKWGAVIQKAGIPKQ